MRRCSGSTLVRSLLIATVGFLLVGVILLIWGGKPEDLATSHSNHKDHEVQDDPTTPATQQGAIKIERSLVQSTSSPDGRITTHGLHISVVDNGGASIEGAEIFGFEGETFFNIGVSDAGGVLDLNAPRRFFDRIVVQAKGYQSKEVNASGSRNERITVVLEEGIALVGRVTGNPDWGLEGITVLAYRKGRSISPLVASQVKAGNPGELWARTSADGSFSINGGQPGIAYDFISAGSGLFSPEPVSGTSNMEVLIPVLPGFGAVVGLVEGNGGPLLLSPTIDGIGPRWGLRSGHGQSIASVNPVLSLGGVPPELCSINFRFTTVLFYCADFGGKEFGPVDYSVKLPGYNRVASVIWLEAVKEEIQMRTIALKSSTSGKGDLQVRLDGLPPSGPEEIADMSGAAQIVLEGVGENAERYSIGIWDLQEEDHVFTNLPSGQFDMRLNLLSYFGSSPPADRPPLRIEILANGVTQVEFDMSHFGALEIDLSDSEGNSVDGLVMFQVLRAEPYAEYFVGFHRAPYIVPCLGQGDYEVSPVGKSSDNGPEPRSVQIAAGIKTQVALEIP